MSLATAIEVRMPKLRFTQVTVSQTLRAGKPNDFSSAKALLNGTDIDRGDVWRGTTLVSGITPTSTTQIGGHQGPIGFSQTHASPAPSTIRPSNAQVPILALTYAGSGGPKHCRGELIQKTHLLPPLEQWINGSCINLQKEARCGVFFADKGDNCEAQLFNAAHCYNTTRTYVNTVVFMPEERAVGALWGSMFVQCGVKVPEAKMLDPGILGDALRKPGVENPGAG